MSKKNLKRFMALGLAATMSFGSIVTVFADGTSATETGTGTYEGKDGEIPAISVTLPTTLTGVYNYIADPNGLISKLGSNDERFGGTAADIDTDNKGILFNYDTNKYGSTSKKLEAINKSYKAVDVTVKLEQKTAGSAGIEYAENATFETTDTAKKIYLAVTDGEATPKTIALSADKAAVLTTVVPGKESNYTLKYENNKYVYKENQSAAGWEKCGFALIGALNNNATWEDGITFPEIQVTWSYAEHVDATEAYGTVTGGKLWMALSASQGFSARPSSVTVNGSAVTDYDVNSGGWVAIDAPTSGNIVLIVVGDTTYKVIAP